MKSLKLCLIFFVLFSLTGCPKPTDESLINNFHENEEKFEELVRMILEDKGLVAVSYYLEPENPTSIGVSKKRIREYRSKMSKLKIRDGFNAFTRSENGDSIPDEIAFYVWSASAEGGGCTGGYAYRKDKPESLVNQINDCSPPKGHFLTMDYKRIKENWYLFSANASF